MDSTRGEVLTKKLREASYEANQAELVAFHMTDWLNDLKNLHDMFEHLDSLDAEEVANRIVAFLTHVPNHINASAYLVGLGAPQDAFDLGFSASDH